MKKLYALTLAFALTFTLAFAPASMAAAQKIAVVNIQQIMKDSTAAKSVREQLENKQKAYQAEITKKEEALKAEDKELGKQRSVLSKEAFEKKAAAFRKKATNMQKDVQSRKAMLDKGFQTALTDIQQAVTSIIADLAKEKGFQVAVPTSQILYADPATDISDDVLKQLNKKLPDLKVKFEK